MTVASLAHVLAQPLGVEVVVVEVRDVEVVGAADGPRVEPVVAREREPRPEVGGVEPRIAQDAPGPGLDVQAGVAEEGDSHRADGIGAEVPGGGGSWNMPRRTCAIVGPGPRPPEGPASSGPRLTPTQQSPWSGAAPTPGNRTKSPPPSAPGARRANSGAMSGLGPHGLLNGGRGRSTGRLATVTFTG